MVMKLKSTLEYSRTFFIALMAKIVMLSVPLMIKKLIVKIAIIARAVMRVKARHLAKGNET